MTLCAPTSTDRHMTDAQTRPTTGFDWHDADCGFYEGHGFDGEPLTLPCDCGFPAAIAQVEREARQQALTDAIAADPRDRLRQTLTENGIPATAPTGLHSWRCEYYLDIDPAKGGGPCDCVETLLDDLCAAVIDTLTRLRDGT